MGLIAKKKEHIYQQWHFKVSQQIQMDVIMSNWRVSIYAWWIVLKGNIEWYSAPAQRIKHGLTTNTRKRQHLHSTSTCWLVLLKLFIKKYGETSQPAGLLEWGPGKMIIPDSCPRPSPNGQLPQRLAAWGLHGVKGNWRWRSASNCSP